MITLPAAVSSYSRASDPQKPLTGSKAGRKESLDVFFLISSLRMKSLAFATPPDEERRMTTVGDCLQPTN